MVQQITSLKSTRLVIALLAAGAIGGGSVSARPCRACARRTPHRSLGTGSPMRRGTPRLPASRCRTSPQITAQYGPAVVNISVTGKARADEDSPVAGRGQREDPFGNDPFFEFFRRFQQGQGQARARATRRCAARVRASSSAPTASS
jgi:serine protease Do